MNFVYADFTKEVKEIAQAIEEESAVSCRTFHGKMSDESKDLTLRAFLDANIPILVATESFEVGVSNPSVDIVLRIGCMRNLNVILESKRKQIIKDYLQSWYWAYSIYTDECREESD